MHCRASVAHHEYKFRVREELEDVRAHLQGEWVLVAQPRRGLGVSRYYFQAERRYRAVYHLKKNSRFSIFQAPKDPPPFNVRVIKRASQVPYA